MYVFRGLTVAACLGQALAFGSIAGIRRHNGDHHRNKIGGNENAAADCSTNSVDGVSTSSLEAEVTPPASGAMFTVTTTVVSTQMMTSMQTVTVTAVQPCDPNAQSSVAAAPALGSSGGGGGTVADTSSAAASTTVATVPTDSANSNSFAPDDPNFKPGLLSIPKESANAVGSVSPGQSVPDTSMASTTTSMSMAMSMTMSTMMTMTTSTTSAASAAADSASSGVASGAVFTSSLGALGLGSAPKSGS